jgi:hypothetical protein
MKYQIVGATSTQKLEAMVNLFISEGWLPQGGMTASGNGFYQAMIKK